MDKNERQAFKEKLLARLKELDHRLVKIEDDLEQPGSADYEERATEREGDEVLEDLSHAGIVEVRQIQAALARLEDGTYGDCVKCEEPISAERLTSLPHTPVCRHCA